MSVSDPSGKVFVKFYIWDFSHVGFFYLFRFWLNRRKITLFCVAVIYSHNWDGLFSVRYALRPKKTVLPHRCTVFCVRYKLRMKKQLSMERQIYVFCPVHFYISVNKTATKCTCIYLRLTHLHVSILCYSHRIPWHQHVLVHCTIIVTCMEWGPCIV